MRLYHQTNSLLRQLFTNLHQNDWVSRHVADLPAAMPPAPVAVEPTASRLTRALRQCCQNLTQEDWASRNLAAPSPERAELERLIGPDRATSTLATALQKVGLARPADGAPLNRDS
jgi:hypothetical protein